jgi:predicted aminopeptidase
MVLKFSPRKIPLPKLASFAALAGALLLLGGCGVTYLAQAARGQLAVMRARQPIDKVIAKPSTPDTLKQQLVRAKRIRDFASTELALPDNAAYRSYADIGRRFVVWNVVATPEFSVTPLHWCFPVVGCVAYRGYFQEADARAFAAALEKQGDDVMVGGVPAYSTLGHIADPLLSTVTGYSELDLAELVFHELAHQVVYIKGDTAYNEAFATAVEEAGVARYAARFADAATLATWQRHREVRRQVVALFVAARGDLDALYRHAPASPPEALRTVKAERLARLAADIRALEQREGVRSGYASWIDAGLNNAHLALLATYYDQVPHFQKLLSEDCGGSMPCLYQRVREEAKAREPAARRALEPGPHPGFR